MGGFVGPMVVIVLDVFCDQATKLQAIVAKHNLKDSMATSPGHPRGCRMNKKLFYSSLFTCQASQAMWWELFCALQVLGTMVGFWPVGQKLLPPPFHPRYPPPGGSACAAIGCKFAPTWLHHTIVHRTPGGGAWKCQIVQLI